MGKFSQVIFRSTSENSEEMHQNLFLFGIFSSLRATISEIKYFKLRKTRNTKNRLMMFKCSIRVLLLPVSALFQYNFVIHTHNTKRSKFIHSLIGRSEATYRTFSYRGAHIWNYISQNVPKDVSYACFKI